MNKQYLKYLIKKNKKLMIVQFLIAIALFCYVSLNAPGVNVDTYRGTLFNLFGFSASNIRIYLYISIMIYPIYMHRVNYTQNGNDLALSLPINKDKQKLCSLFYYWLLIIVPYVLIIFMMYIFRNQNAYPLNPNNELITNLLIILPITVMYLINSIIAIKSNNLIDAIILTITFNITMALLPSLLHTFFSANSYMDGCELFRDNYFGYTLESNTVFYSIFSMHEMIGVFGTYIYSGFYALSKLFIILIGLNLVYIIVLLYLNLYIYRNKKSDASGSNTTSRLGYPLVIFLATFMMITIANSQSNFKIACIAYAIIFCIYLGAYFIAYRKMRVTLKSILGYIAIIVFSLTLRSICVYTYGFNSNMGYQDIENYDVKDIEVSPGQHGEVGYLYAFRGSDDEQQAAKAEIVAIQNDLRNQERERNLWWYADEKEKLISFSYKNKKSSYSIDSANAIQYSEGYKNYDYMMDKETYEKVLKRLEKVSIVSLKDN